MAGQTGVAVAVVPTLIGGLLAGAADARAQVSLPAGFVHLSLIDDTIIQDMRYATPFNFTGAAVRGYEAGACILLREVAEALKRVQVDLLARGYSLKVYDCYRPRRAVAAFVAWVSAPGAGARTSYLPRVARKDLIRLGYIAASSSHAKGISVDVSLVRLPVVPPPLLDPARAYGPCTGPSAERMPDDSIDMGTGYDCFDPKSGARSDEVSAEARANRKLLADAMVAQGFGRHLGEWWHFDYRRARAATPQDFPVVAPPTGNR